MKRRGVRGQSLVESAFVLAAFMGLVFGIAQVAETLFMRQTLAQRVDEGARWGALHRYDVRAIRNVVLFGAPEPEDGATAVFGLTADAVEVANPGCPGADCRVSVAIGRHGVRSVEPME